MNQYILLGTSVVIILLFWIYLKNSKVSGVAKINPADAKKRLDTEKGVILLDVRTKDEYLEKHIPKSMLIPVDILQNEANKKLPDKNAEIFVYCRGGNRSAMATKILANLGYTNIHNLGGIISWPYETVTGNK